MKMKFVPNGRDLPKLQPSPTSPTVSLDPICRICHEGDSKEELVAPCHCTGSMAGVHRACLERWLSSSNSDTCEICKFKFVIFRQPMPFTEWILRPSNPEDCRNLTGDLLCFILLTPLAAVSSYLCFTGAKSYTSWNVKWEASGLICLSLILIAIYFTWCTITVRYHIQNWRQWRATHHNVHLIQLRRLSDSSQANNSLQNNTTSSAPTNQQPLLDGNQLTSIVISTTRPSRLEMTTSPSIRNSSHAANSSHISPLATVNQHLMSDIDNSAAFSTVNITLLRENPCLQPLLLNSTQTEHEILSETEL